MKAGIEPDDPGPADVPHPDAVPAGREPGHAHAGRGRADDPPGARRDLRDRVVVAVRDPDVSGAGRHVGRPHAGRDGADQPVGLGVDHGQRVGGGALGIGRLIARGEDRRHGRGQQNRAAGRDQDGAAAGPSGRDRRPASDRRVDRRVLPEDRLLECLELAARLEPEPVGERTTRVLVARERIRLTARAVEGEHELGAQPLARRVLPDEGLELWDQGRVAAERQVGLDALFERQQPELGQPSDLGLRELLVGEVRERRTAPHVERLLEQAAGPPGVIALERLATVGAEALESAGVELVRLDVEYVAAPVE